MIAAAVPLSDVLAGEKTRGLGCLRVTRDAKTAALPLAGVKISARNFGRDRRYPITNKFREEIGTGSSVLKRSEPPGDAPRTVLPRADGGDVS